MQFCWQASPIIPKKRSSQACSTCRARKKRCYHVENTEPVQLVEAVNGDDLTSTSYIRTRRSNRSLGRINGYDPATVLAHLSTSPGHTDYETSEALRSSCEQDELPDSNQRLNFTSEVFSTLASGSTRRTVLPPRLSDHHRRYLEETGAFFVLPATVVTALLPIYCSLLDDLIPILDGARVFRDYSNGRASPHLIKAICLVTSKTKQAEPFLMLSENGSAFCPFEFSSRLLTGLDAALKSDLEPNRVVKIQILALLHLHHDENMGIPQSLAYFSQAICEAWSISLHLKTTKSADPEQDRFLWWSLRNFDRLNKPLLGSSPFMIDDADINIPKIKPVPGRYRTQLMDVALELGDLMTTATKIYKASTTATIDDCQTFPSLAETTANTNFENFHRSHRAYFGIWYHVAAMLSCRYSRPGSAPYNRRLSSADQIIDCVVNKRHESLPPLPLIPYALALATTAIFRAFRDQVRNKQKTCDDLRLCNEALDDLSQVWASIKGVAKLADILAKFLEAESPHTLPGEYSQHTSTDVTFEVSNAAQTMIDHSSIIETAQQGNDGSTYEALTPSLPSLTRVELDSQPMAPIGPQQLRSWPDNYIPGFQGEPELLDVLDHEFVNLQSEMGFPGLLGYSLAFSDHTSDLSA